MITLLVLYALCGWLAGIAINHLADVLPTRKTVFLKPFCLACETERPQQQWSALIAWATKQQSCFMCGTPRSTFKRAVIIELVVPVFFVFLMGRYGPSLELALVTIYTFILILVTVTDLEHRLIFNVVILPSILFAMVAAFFTPGLAWPAAYVGGVGAFVVIYVVALLSRGGLGEGDVTLSTFLGFILAFPQIILSIMFGVFLGGIVAVILLVSGKVNLKTFIPYGPFLTITGWIMLIWGGEIWQYFFW